LVEDFGICRNGLSLQRYEHAEVALRCKCPNQTDKKNKKALETAMYEITFVSQRQAAAWVSTSCALHLPYISLPSPPRPTSPS
jgi:hypothetical protein